MKQVCNNLVTLFVWAILLCVIVNQTTRIIWNVISPLYMKPPSCTQWKSISQDFDRLWNFPNCIGALDGKHVCIQKPGKSGSAFYNYKKSFSINLMTICDAHCRFTMIDVGALGRQNDSGVFQKTVFGKKLMSGGNLNIPHPKFLPKSTLETPHFLVADEAFPLSPHILKPFAGNQTEPHKRIYNYRLSRARRTIENAFGIMVSRFRIFRNHIVGKPENVNYYVKAACVLHNFLRTWDMENKSTHYSNPQNLERESEEEGTVIRGVWSQRQSLGMVDMRRVGANNYNQGLRTTRENIAWYFVHRYPVPWQNNYIGNASWNPVRI